MRTARKASLASASMRCTAVLYLYVSKAAAGGRMERVKARAGTGRTCVSALALPHARDRQTDGDRDPSDALRCSHSQSLSGAQSLMTLASGTPRKVSRGVVHPCTQVSWTSWLRMPRRSIFFKRMLSGCSTSPLTCSRQRPPKAREGDSHVDRRGCPRSIASHSVVSAPEAAILSVIVPTFGVTFPVP